MNLNNVITGSPVTSGELRAVRDQRVLKKWELLTPGGEICLVEFSLNIAGTVKTFPFARAAFREEVRELSDRLSRFSVLKTEVYEKNTGDCAFFLLKSQAIQVKKFLVSVEESHPLGRLFNLDVCGPDGISVKRHDLGLLPRTCLVCGEDAHVCAQKKSHSIELIQWQTAKLFHEFFRDRAADQAASAAVRGLLYEVSTTPKPGLVDRNNSGSHKDMDFFSFLDSSASLIPWFRDFFSIGWEHGDETGDRLFERLRFAGQNAEAKMFSATGGVNTHKGLIFASAILCGALGKIYKDAFLLGKKPPVPLDSVVGECKKLGRCSLKDFKAEDRRQDVSAGAGHRRSPEETAGERIHTAYGIAGARGEAALGFPSALTIGLPALKA